MRLLSLVQPQASSGDGSGLSVAVEVSKFASNQTWTKSFGLTNLRALVLQAVLPLPALVGRCADFGSTFERKLGRMP